MLYIYIVGILALIALWSLRNAPVMDKDYRVFPKDYHDEEANLSVWYVGYQYENQNQPGGIWVIEAANPDEACGEFLRSCGLQQSKIMCCTQDYAFACACLLKPEKE